MLSCTNMPTSINDLAQNEALQGGVLGGLLCGGAAKIAGLNREQIVIATAGCAGIGAVIGKQLQDRRKKYASDEDFFEGEIRAVQKFNFEQTAYKNQLVTEMKDLKNDNRRLVKLKNKNRISSSKFATHNAELKSKREQAETETRKMQEELKFQDALYIKLKEANGTSSLNRLQKEINELKTTIAAIEEQRNQLVELENNLA